MIQENVDVIKEEFGDDDHAMTMSALQSIQQRYDSAALSSSTNKSQWWNPLKQGGSESIEVQQVAPTLVAYGDEKPDSELVYAVGFDPIKKRVTVAFRGSVTPSDFLTDACISLNHQPNPVKDVEESQSDTIGLHHGFYEYLLKPGTKGGENKYTEIMRHVATLFEDPEKQKDYKLYVTGHSLGGALATLFSLHAAASALTDSSNNIPTPVTCVSVASPRVGESTFQSAFRLLEERGALRHLRIANDKDPVTLMPKSSGKKIWSMLSPVSYLAFKAADKDFEDKETYRHTGIKLKLRKREEGNTKEPYEIGYSGAAKAKEEENPEKSKVSSKIFSFKENDIPGVVFHFGNTYCEHLVGVKDELTNMGLSLNELYKEKALATK